MKIFPIYSKFILILGLSIFLFYSCKPKDSNPTPSTPTQLDASTGKSVASTSNISASSAIKDINANAGIAAFRSLGHSGIVSTNSGIFPTGSLRNGVNATASDIFAVTKSIISQVGGSENGRIAPDFNASKGVWEYNFTLKDFTKTGPASEIIIKFPDSTNLAQNTGVNNCTYTIHQLNTTFYNNTSLNKIDTLVTLINGDIYVSGSKVFDFNYAVTYSNNTATKGDYTYNLGDYNVVFNFQIKSILSPFLNFNYALSKSGSSIYSYTVSPTYNGDSISTLDYTVSVGDVKFVSNFQYGKYINNYLKSAYSPIVQSATDTLIASPYDSGTLNQISTGAKIGDLKYLRSKITGSNCTTCSSFNFRSKRVIVYNDGSYQDLSTVLSSLKTSLLQYFLFTEVY